MATRQTRQSGIALISVLVMMVMLTLVATISMRTTNIDLRMAKNSRDKSVAFQIADGTVGQVDDILANHMFYRGWSGFTLAAGFATTDPNSVLYEADVTDPFDFADPNRKDLTYSHGDFNADIFISRIRASIAFGSGVSLGEGYSGLGRGAAGGGGFLFFDISSRSNYINNSSSTTGGFYRLTIRN